MMNPEKYRQLIEAFGPLRARIQRVLANDSEALRAALLDKLDSLLRESRDTLFPDGAGLDVERLIAKVADELRIPVVQRRALEQHLREGQAMIAKLRAQMYGSITDRALSLDAASLFSRSEIDFPSIKQSVNKTVQRTMRYVLDRGGEVGDVVRALRSTRVAAHQARTLANTALAQYDNAYTFHLGKQAGISKYKYHGPPAQRDFCKALLATGRFYTLAEISKMDNGQGIPVWTSCGGYNCRHEWLPVPVRDEVSEEWFNRDVRVQNMADPEIQESVFGRVLSDEDCVLLSGAPDGANVHLKDDGRAIRMLVFHELYEDSSSRLYYREGGQLHAHNEILELTDRTPRGFGLRILQQQIQHARRIGVRSIHTLAARNSTMNGYYTWGRYGFDGPLDKRHIARLPEGWKDVEYLSDLMATEEGREIWSTYGESIRLVFDLAEESYSMQVLTKYLEDKKVLPWPL